MKRCPTSLTTLLWLLPPALALAADRPNVLFIAVDDLRCELGCYGVKEIKSPNIDRLATRAAVFNRAYCQQSVCNPSRASLLTGLRPDTIRVWDLVTSLRDQMPDVVTLPQYFKQNGYYAVGMGKIFHNTFPDPASWTIPRQPAPAATREYSEATMAKLAQLQAEARKAGMSQRDVANRVRGPATECEDVPDNQRIDGALGDLAVRELRKAAAQQAPFFVAVGFIRPHLPFTPPKKYWDLYDPAKLPLAANPYLPQGMPAVAFGDKSLGGMYELRVQWDCKEAPSPFVGSLPEANRRRLKHGYYASVSFSDAQIGRVLGELDRLGLSEKTIVVLWGDHGWKLGEHNGWCKQTNYEIDTHAPLLIRAPGAKANGQHCDALVEFVDIYPTLCELAGLPVPESLQGKSLAPLLADPSAKVKDAAFSQFPRNHEGRDYMGYALRTDRYRFVEWVDRETGQVVAIELYDHQNDPGENTNIAQQPNALTVLRKLDEQLWQGFAKPAPVVKPQAGKVAAAVPFAQEHILAELYDDTGDPKL
jgi:iduronate 2-sulfatase